MTKPLCYQLPGAAWHVEFQPEALDYIWRYRQKTFLSKEAGGQLYAPRLTAEKVKVCVATGPYPGDKQSRHSYTMRGKAATLDREKQYSLHLALCGLWHTHPEARPSPSGPDLRAINENLKLLDEWESLLIIIQGLSAPPEGLFVGIYHHEQGLKRLELKPRISK